MDFKLDFMKLASILAIFPKPFKPCVSFYVCTQKYQFKGGKF